MARFYGSMQGNRGQSTRMGTPNSGLSAHIRGWNVGVEVDCVADKDNDEIRIYATGGSNNGRERMPIATLRMGEHGKIVCAYDQFDNAIKALTK